MMTMSKQQHPAKLATVTEVVPRRKFMDGVVERTAAEVVTVRCDDGNVYNFITGSINTCPIELRYKGCRVLVEFDSTPSHFLPFLRRVCVFCDSPDCSGQCRESLAEHAS